MEYTLIRSRRRSMSLSLDRGGNITVRAPLGCPGSAVDAFVAEKRGWIEKQLAKLEKTRAEAEKYGTFSDEELKRMAAKLRDALSKKLPYYEGLLGVDHGRVTIRLQKSKWGSCSSKGGLNFNCLLAAAPEEVLDYVIVHELCHRRHMDHSPAFWALVESVIPDHKERRKWLREHGGALMERAFPSRD